jgi:hypothetical protein
MSHKHVDVGRFVWVDIEEPALWVIGKVLEVVDASTVKVEVIGNTFDDFVHEARGQVLETAKYLEFDMMQLGKSTLVMFHVKLTKW